MRLILVRHGQTEANVAGINQGWLPGKLTAVGREQAERVALRLAEEPIDIVYASDLARVQETLLPLRRLRPALEVVNIADLREQHMGGFEGAPWGSIRAAAEAAGRELVDFPIPDGESIVEMHARVKAFIDRVVAVHRGTAKTVCVYTSGGPVVAACLHLLDRPDSEFRDWHPQNCQYTILEEDAGGWKATCRNADA